MKDDAGLGPSHSTWVDKMIQRVRNVIKTSNKKARQSGATDNDLPTTKKRCKTPTLLMRYPITSRQPATAIDDAQSLEGHLKALNIEMEKTKPRDNIILPLMKSTFSSRREWILESKETLNVILKKYKPLSLPAVIEQELDLIIGKSTKSQFLHNWSGKFVPAILAYAKKSTKGSVKTLVEMIEMIESEEKEKTSLKLLYEFWKPRNQPASFNCIYEKFETDDRSIQELCKLPPIRNSPRIIEISDMKETSYHNVCEQTVFCKTFSYSESLFLFCSVLYEYPKKVNNVLCFLQDHVLNFPDCSSRPTNFVTVVTDIKKNII